MNVFLNMIVQFFKLYLLVSFFWLGVNSFVFENEDKHYRSSVPSQDSPSITARRRPVSNPSPSSIGRIFNIPLAVIQSTSAAAQAFSPNNANMINKVFDIPVQTLQAIGDFVKDVTPSPNNNDYFEEFEDERLIRIWEQQQLQDAQQSYQQQQQQFQIVQDPSQQNEGHTTHRRHIFDGWASAFTDLFLGEQDHVTPHGHHGSVFGNDIYLINGQGNRQGHKKKKHKKNKHGHSGGHGHGHHHGDDQSFYNGNIYDNILPLPLFSWNRFRISDKIQNKIAPGYNDYSRIIY